MEKPNKVNIIRYIRPVTMFSAPLVDNMYGVTLYIELDYVDRLVKFGYSVCAGDNFNKKDGIAFAKVRFDTSPETLKMPENGFVDCSVSAFIIENIENTNISARNKVILTSMWFAG